MSKKTILIIIFIAALVLVIYSCSQISAINGANGRAEKVVSEYFSDKLQFDGWRYEVLYNYGGFGNGYFANGVFDVSGNLYIDGVTPTAFYAVVKFDNEWDSGRLVSMDVPGFDVINY